MVEGALADLREMKLSQAIAQTTFTNENLLSIGGGGGAARLADNGGNGTGRPTIA